MGANRKLRIGGFKTPIWKICDQENSFRPSLECVYIKNGLAYATDAHVLIRQSLKEIHNIPEEQAKHLEGKMLHRSLLKELERYTLVEFKEDHIRCVNTNHINVKLEYTSHIEAAYPDTEKVIKDFKADKKIRIGLNPSLLSKLMLAMDTSTGQAIISFNKKEGGYIKVTTPKCSEKHQMGLVMPVYLSSEDYE